MFKRFLCILLSLMLLAGITAALAEEPAAAEAEQAAGAEAAESQDPVLLVTINGEEIMSNHEEVEYWINYYLYQLSASGYDVSDLEMMQTIEQYALLNTMRFVLINQKAAELGLDKFTDEQKAEWEKAAKETWEQAVESHMQNITDASTDDEKAAARADAIAELKNEGYDEESYVQEYIDSEITNELINRLMDKVAEGTTVTDDEIQAHFDSLVEEDKANYGNDVSNYEFYTQYYGQPSYYTPEGYRGITHILLKVDDDLLNTWKDLSARYEEQKSAAVSPEETPEPVEGETAEAETAESTPAPTAEPVTEEMVEAAKKAILDSVQSTVDEINAKLKDGASFDQLIQEYGTDPGMQDETMRSTGYAVHKDSILWDPAFTAGAIALEKVGDVSEPVVGQYGVHILYYLRDIPGGAIELTEEMKNQIHDELLDEKRNAALNEALDKWMEEAVISYTEAGEAWKVPEETETAATEESATEATPAD